MPQAAPNGIPRDVIQGIAVVSLIFLISAWLPVIGLAGLLILPLPVFYYRAKLGRKNGLIVLSAAAGVMTAVIGGFSPDLILLIGLLLLGFVLCELVERQLPVEQIILFAGGAVFTAGIFSLLIYSNLSGSQLGTLLTVYVKKNLELSLQFYKDVGMPEENVRMIAGSMDTIRYYLVRILPALCAAFILLVAWINFLGARSVFIRKGVTFPDFGALNRWQAPEFLVWGVIASGLLLLLPRDAVKIVGLNTLIVLMTVYFFQGIAIVSYYFDKKQLPAPLRVFFYCLIAVWHLLLLLVVSLGFFDMWADFRKLKAEEEHGGPPGT